mmetsp:Transcript_16010/g.35090  ORF Transcript_16010/g.35090 Transcript_16010/m.35090 type:complete len:350 (-) Transcript_16010:8-1057(-)
MAEDNNAFLIRPTGLQEFRCPVQVPVQNWPRRQLALPPLFVQQAKSIPKPIEPRHWNHGDRVAAALQSSSELIIVARVIAKPGKDDHIRPPSLSKDEGCALVATRNAEEFRTVRRLDPALGLVAKETEGHGVGELQGTQLEVAAVKGEVEAAAAVHGLGGCREPQRNEASQIHDSVHAISFNDLLAGEEFRYSPLHRGRRGLWRSSSALLGLPGDALEDCLQARRGPVHSPPQRRTRVELRGGGEGQIPGTQQPADALCCRSLVLQRPHSLKHLRLWGPRLHGCDEVILLCRWARPIARLSTEDTAPEPALRSAGASYRTEPGQPTARHCQGDPRHLSMGSRVCRAATQ